MIFYLDNRTGKAPRSFWTWQAVSIREIGTANGRKEY